MLRANHIFLSTALISVLAVYTLPAGSDTVTYYRWQDANGTLIHSDRPPPKGVDYEVISAGSSLKRSVPAEEGAVSTELDAEPGAKSDKKLVGAGTIRSANPELCARARTNLDSLSNSEKVRVRTDNGEIRYLSPEEIIIEREKAKAQISVYCD